MTSPASALLSLSSGIQSESASSGSHSSLKRSSSLFSFSPDPLKIQKTQTGKDSPSQEELSGETLRNRLDRYNRAVQEILDHSRNENNTLRAREISFAEAREACKEALLGWGKLIEKINQLQVEHFGEQTLSPLQAPAQAASSENNQKSNFLEREYQTFLTKKIKIKEILQNQDLKLGRNTRISEAIFIVYVLTKRKQFPGRPQLELKGYLVSALMNFVEDHCQITNPAGVFRMLSLKIIKSILQCLLSEQMIDQEQYQLAYDKVDNPSYGQAIIKYNLSRHKSERDERRTQRSSKRAGAAPSLSTEVGPHRPIPIYPGHETSSGTPSQLYPPHLIESAIEGDLQSLLLPPPPTPHLLPPFPPLTPQGSAAQAESSTSLGTDDSAANPSS